MKKALFFLSVVAVYLNADMFTHSTDHIESYEFSLEKEYKENLLAQKLQRFQEAQVSDFEVQQYLKATTSNEIFASDVIVKYTKKQMQDLNITQDDVISMHQKPVDTFIDKGVKYIEVSYKKFSKENNDTNVIDNGVKQ